jgi:hypothetical protein
MSGRLEEFKELFWWSGQEDWKTKTPPNDSSAFIKLVFGSDSGLGGMAPVVNQYRALFNACDAGDYAADDHGRNTGEHTSIVKSSETRDGIQVHQISNILHPFATRPTSCKSLTMAQKT